MSKNSKIGFCIFCVAIILLSTSIPKVKATTVGDSTFEVKPDDNIMYKITKNYLGIYKYNVGDKINLTLGDIYAQGGFANINLTIDYYNTTTSGWSTPVNNQKEIWFNESQDVYQLGATLQPTVITEKLGWLFVIPFPLNFTLIKNFLNQSGAYNSYSNTSTVLTMTDITTTDYIYAYTTNGTLISYEIKLAGLTLYKMELASTSTTSGVALASGDDDDDDDDDAVIPGYDLVFLIGVMSLILVIIILNRRKIFELHKK